jgi:hypothetical protein
MSSGSIAPCASKTAKNPQSLEKKKSRNFKPFECVTEGKAKTPLETNSLIVWLAEFDCINSLNLEAVFLAASTHLII